MQWRLCQRSSAHHEMSAGIDVQELKPETNETELEVVRSQYANVTALLAVKRK